MKKLIVAALLVVGITTLAQKKVEKKDKSEKLNSEQKVNLLVKKMTRDLDLNEKQQAEYKNLIAKQTENREEKKAALKELKGKDRKEIKVQMELEQEAVSEEMKKILTPEQFTKWTQIRDEREKKMKEKRAQKLENDK